MTTPVPALPRAALMQMIVGACAISTTSIFVKYAHVGPTMSGFYRMAFGGLMLLDARLTKTQGGLTDGRRARAVVRSKQPWPNRLA